MESISRNQRGWARVFVSSQAVDRHPASELIAELQKRGVQLERSPSNPLHAKDPRWEDWLEGGLAAALRRCGVFVVVVDAGWDSSSWMGEEAHLALEARGSIMPLRGFFWNPEGMRMTAAGMVRHLREELPIDSEKAAAVLVSVARGRTTG